MVIDVPDDESIPWTTTKEVISLGSPSGTALSSMCVALSIIIEYIYYTEEQNEQNIGRLTLTQDVTLSISRSVSDDPPCSRRESLFNSSIDVIKYPLWKKVCFILLAVTFAIIMGLTRFILGAHSMDQIIFGWLLGLWLALSYFALVRDHVHHHVTELTTGQTTSSNCVYYSVSTGIWLAFMLTVTITFLINKDKTIIFPNNMLPVFGNPVKWVCATNYDFWSTWVESGFMSAGLGGYFGILHQHKRYGGQLFIQQKIDQLRKSKIQRFVLRYLIVFALGSPLIIMTTIVYSTIMPLRNSDLINDDICNPQKI